MMIGKPEMGKAKILSGYINKGLGKGDGRENVEEYEMRIRRSFYVFFFLRAFR